jgi:RNA polymerase sigma factor (sigma-70 family)
MKSSATGHPSLPPDVERRLTWTNRELVDDCLKGNESAWAALLARYKNLIFSIPIRDGLPHEDAADIFQSVCVDLLVEMPKLREPEALAAWLITVTRHKCQRFRGSAEAGSAEETMEFTPSSNPTPDKVLRQLQEEQTLREALLTMSPRCRRLLQALFYEDPPRPYQELAHTLALSVGSIGFIRGRCLKKLRTELEKTGF